MKSSQLLSQALLVSLTLSSTALADSPTQRGPRTIRSMAEQADVVFRGVVEHITYARSLPSTACVGGMPHTFVTYRVDEVLHGPDPGPALTLRFAGGFDDRTGDALTVSIVPRFDLGDEDILFVRSNTLAQCPLVGHRSGRFRLIEGKVFSEGGHAVEIDHETGAVRLGDRFRLEAVEFHTVGPHVLRMDLGASAKATEPQSADADTFAAAVAWSSAGLLAPLGPVVQASPRMAFEGPDLTPVAPAHEAHQPQADKDEIEANEGPRPVKRRIR